MTRRLFVPTVIAAVALLAAACGDDDPVTDSDTTVPTVAAPPATDPPRDEAAAAEVEDDDAAGDDAGSSTTPTTTTLPDGDLDAVEIATQPVADLTQPIETVVAPNGEWWIAQRTGEVLMVDPASGAIGDIVVDISSDTVARGERGLLGMAVDEDHLYLSFTDTDGTSQVDAWTLGPDGRPGERTRLLALEQPFGNHNGGGIAIGPDDHLYIGFGDGGSGGDPIGAGQDTSTWLGALLRIDPTPGAATPYGIPTDNPFADREGGLPEIFLIGVRNPWRFSFDPSTDNLWIGDVGQNAVEEVDLLLGANGWGLGANLGWNLREGTREFAGARPEGNVDPVYQYFHGGNPTGCSVTGGRVYRGTAIPDLVGSYVFGDYCTARLWAVSIAGGVVNFRDLGVPVPGGDLVGFGLDPEGELVTLSIGGDVARIVAA